MLFPKGPKTVLNLLRIVNLLSRSKFDTAIVKHSPGGHFEDLCPIFEGKLSSKSLQIVKTLRQ